MAEPAVRIEVREGVATLTLDRPETRNALSAEMIAGLAGALEHAKQAPEVRVVVLTGAGEKAFSAGGDLGGRGLEPKAFIERHFERGGFADLFRQLNRLGKPTIARVRGHCLAGGFGLALGCDLVVASDDSWFGTPEVKRGLFPMIIMATLFRNVGRKKGMELILTGERISAREAERIGLINHAVPPEELDAKVAELAGRIASLSPAVLRLGREAFYGMADLEFERALDHLQTMLTLNLATDDALEGVRAFLEKREPVWKGS
jgi:enoyl-CoA hydratase/carnithine racemase